MMYADFGFKVDGGGAAYCSMVHHGATADAVDRGCFDLPEFASLCLDMAWMMHVVFKLCKSAVNWFSATLDASTA
jgi:hypothetical protein